MTHSSSSGPRVIPDPEALREVMQTPFTFSDQQFAAITAPLEPAVVIAGAGSGKTTVMAARVVWLVATGQLTPDQVLGLTFTTKAANELATGIRAALSAAQLGGLTVTDEDGNEELLEPVVATYNAYAASLLTEHGLRIGHEPDTRVITDASRYQLAARTIARYDAPIALLSDHPETVINYMLGLDGAMSEHLVGPDDVRRFHAEQVPRFDAAIEQEARKTRRDDLAKVLNTIGRREELLGLVDGYRRLKRSLGLMDFSDQIELGAKLAVEQPDVGAAEREKYRVILLDEYQDTSVAQALMLKHLFSGADPEHGLGHPVTAVGDPNQAIYGWRGASVSNIIGFGTDFPPPPGRRPGRYSLTVSRRSDARILQAANELAEPLLASSDAVSPLESAPGAADGVVRTAVFDTHDDELGWLPSQVIAAREQLGCDWSGIGVLTRDNAHAADVFDALTEAEIPVEIVGLQGLLRLPEVAEVVATLSLLHNLTANASMLMLLTGPRWAIGERDLVLLGRQAARLALSNASTARDPQRTIEEELALAVEGADPTEVASLGDALADPGDAAYSAEALERFQLLDAELRMLRRHAGEPLLDLVRRIIDTTGIDVELASSVSPAARARRDNLDIFVKAVAEFEAVDGDVTLSALLAYLKAEDDFGNGLDIATPTEADSVKLLTVHRAKGLEWPAVFLVGVCEERFPNSRARVRWTSGPGVLPIPLRGDRHDQPQLPSADAAGLDALAQATRDYQATEELRLGYVAVTRAKHLLVMSAYCWNGTRKSPLGPSAFLTRVRDTAARWGAEPDRWVEKPDKTDPNPLLEQVAALPWPVEAHHTEIERRLAAAGAVRAASAVGDDGSPDAGLDLVETARVDGWDADIDRLLAEARTARQHDIVVPLPDSLSATAFKDLRDDPDQFARQLARPLPRPPSPSARFGTKFHAWVEARFGQQQMLDPDELPGRADAEVDSEADLADLIKAFEAGPFGERAPSHVEPPFALVLDGQVVRGRIDAVYRTDDGGYQVVDWKTNKAATADPLQLALYRVAWAELMGVPVETVGAAFYYVRTGELVEYDDLPDRAGLEELMRGTVD